MSGTTGAVGAAGETGEGRGLLERIRCGFDILRFRPAAVDEALEDDGAFVAALGMAALAGVAAAAGSASSLAGGVGLAIVYLSLSLAVAGIIHLGARVAFAADGEFVRFYGAFGHTYLLLWLLGVPVVYALFGWVLWGWQVAATVLVTERAYRLQRVQAAAVVGVPVVGTLLLALLFNSLVALAALASGLVF